MGKILGWDIEVKFYHEIKKGIPYRNYRLKDVEKLKTIETYWNISDITADRSCQLDGREFQREELTLGSIAEIRIPSELAYGKKGIPRISAL